MFDGLSSKRQKLWARAAPGFPSRDRSRRGRLARRQLVGAERGPRFSGRASIAISLLLSCPPRPLGLGEVLLELGPAVRGWAAGKGGGAARPSDCAAGRRGAPGHVGRLAQAPLRGGALAGRRAGGRRWGLSRQVPGWPARKRLLRKWGLERPGLSVAERSLTAVRHCEAGPTPSR